MRLSLNKKYDALDADDTGTVTAWEPTKGASVITFTIKGNPPGTHAAHEFILQFSPNGTYNAKVIQNTKITGVNFLRLENMQGYKHVRIKCLTAEGSASTVDAFLQFYTDK